MSRAPLKLSKIQRRFLLAQFLQEHCPDEFSAVELLLSADKILRIWEGDFSDEDALLFSEDMIYPEKIEHTGKKTSLKTIPDYYSRPVDKMIAKDDFFITCNEFIYDEIFGDGIHWKKSTLLLKDYELSLNESLWSF